MTKNRPRVIWGILFGLLGLPVAYLNALALSGVVLGFFWLFVVGDNPWPAWVEPFIMVFILVVMILTLAVAVILGVQFGKKREKKATS